MLRSRAATLVAVVLLLTVAPVPGARADGPLEADAGDSAVAYAGELLPLHGRARGGAAPYALAWSASVEPARVSGASYDTSSLAPQDVVFTLTVTDALGAVALDTVRHRVESSPILVARNVTLNYGVPDELVGGANVDQRPVFFQVPAGTARIEASVSWAEPAPGAYDLDFRLLTPADADATGNAGATQSNPERATVVAPEAGRWTAKLEPFLNGPTTARVLVQGFPAASLPPVSAGGPYVFGSRDLQTLRASAGGAPVAFAWDLDGDGWYDSPGAEVTSAFVEGEHVARVRVTDASGFEVSSAASVSVRGADTVLRLRCGSDPSTTRWAMEFTSSRGSCWLHGGHHTYFMGDEAYTLRALRGRAFTVEQQLSPPTELGNEPGSTPLHVEVSVDAVTWTHVAMGDYRFVSTNQRQDVFFDAPGASQPFRFVRVHEPRSAAQGLSGYLDHTELDVEADYAGDVETPVVAPDVRALACGAGDVMEDFFPEHPCWFGGIDRYDAPSFWHTYFLGDGARLSRIEGTFTLLPWRTDDWTQGNSTTNATGVAAYVQTSVDGVNWTDAATVRTAFGAPTPFRVDVDTPARFVRFFPEEHARFDDLAGSASNHHPKGYFVETGLVLTGLFAE